MSFGLDVRVVGLNPFCEDSCVLFAGDVHQVD